MSPILFEVPFHRIPAPIPPQGVRAGGPLDILQSRCSKDPVTEACWQRHQLNFSGDVGAIVEPLAAG